MDYFLFTLFNGLSYGLLLFLLSSGFTLAFGLMGVLNIAHASFFMLGAYFAYEINMRLGFAAALLLAPVGVGLIGAAVERYLLRPVRSAGHMAELLLTFGLTYVITELVQLTWGRTAVPYGIPRGLDFPLFVFGGIEYSAYRILVLAVTVAIFIGSFLLFRVSRLGLVVQAALDQPHMVAALGYNVPLVFSGVFAFGAALASIGGVLTGNMLGTQPTMALQLGSLIFVVVVVGGLGSLAGAFIASLLIGVMQTLVASYPVTPAQISEALSIPTDFILRSADLRSLSTASLAPLLPYALMIIVLLVKPRGIMGSRDV
ncbi:branched-chain amino acid ABC transporter permease [Ferrovibrio sp.]|uniref:branched-chain amino acid ABC transporter permease n=1 Tax=Ferrovibrio sp. TaxID=1917215 RepID=UPI003D2B1D97